MKVALGVARDKPMLELVDTDIKLLSTKAMSGRGRQVRERG